MLLLYSGEPYFGYIRVSTAKQGEKGVSLQEQKDAITRHAERFGLEIGRWFEERETGAKLGRPVFSDMLRLLRRKKARGVIIHKIDRSARNLKDWADLGEMIDSGIEVQFANESLDMHTRGGRSPPISRPSLPPTTSRLVKKFVPVTALSNNSLLSAR